jgi:Golgi nucleoside diphosphatase
MDDMNSDSLINADEYNTMSSEKKNKLILIIIPAICIISIGLSIYCFINYFRVTRIKYDDGRDNPKDSLYGCMCDAGSSGTRVSVYSWPKRKENIIPIITEIDRNKTYPGIHQKNEKELEETMNFLIGFCKKRIIELSINSSNLSDVSFYLRATAGMRSISKEEQNKKLDIIRNVIKKSHLKFLKDDWVKVIDGSEEGLFGWIGVNYLNKILFTNEDAGKQADMPYGSIDLGGYSLEITFSTKETIKKHNISLNFTHVNYNIYSYSFEDYGQTRFIEILMELIIKNSSKPENSYIITNPCYLEGYNETYQFKNKNYTFVGKTNISLCQEFIRSIMKINKENEKSMNNVYQPKIPENLKFYGISGLYWIAKFFKIADNKFHSASEFLTATNELCKKKWEDVLKSYKITEKKDKENLKKYCSVGYYVYYFLVEGFKIDKNKEILKFPKNINGKEPAWTLGAMSYEIGLLPL